MDEDMMENEMMMMDCDGNIYAYYLFVFLY